LRANRVVASDCQTHYVDCARRSDFFACHHLKTLDLRKPKEELLNRSSRIPGIDELRKMGSSMARHTCVIWRNVKSFLSSISTEGGDSRRDLASTLLQGVGPRRSRIGQLLPNSGGPHSRRRIRLQSPVRQDSPAARLFHLADVLWELSRTV